MLVGVSRSTGHIMIEKKSSSPVVNEVTFRAILAIMLTFRMVDGILDVNSAFLHGEFENDKKI